jgi:hypothetical protein
VIASSLTPASAATNKTGEMFAVLSVFASDQPSHLRTYSPTHADSAIAILLLASVATRDAWLFLWTSRPFLEQVRALMDALGLA